MGGLGCLYTAGLLLAEVVGVVFVVSPPPSSQPAPALSRGAAGQV